MENVPVNTIRIGLATGEGFFADLLPSQPTIAIAITGRYDDENSTTADTAATTTTGKSPPQPTAFITLLSADAMRRTGSTTPDSAYAQARRAAGRDLENSLLRVSQHRPRRPADAATTLSHLAGHQRLLAFRAGLPDSLRPLAAPLSPARSSRSSSSSSSNSNNSYRTAAENLAGDDPNQIATSTFPGDRAWTFPLGTARYDAALQDHRRPAEQIMPPSPRTLPPSVTAAQPQALRLLSQLTAELRRAEARGLRDPWVVIVAVEPTGFLAPQRWTAYEVLVLVDACRAAAREWAPRERVVFGWRAAGEARRLCVRGGAFWVEEVDPAIGGAARRS